MAINPFLVTLPGDPRVEIRLDLLAKMEAEIDRILSIPEQAVQWFEILSDGHAFTLQFPGYLTDDEKLVLKNRYLAAGWPRVEVYVDYLSGSINHPVVFVRLYNGKPVG